MAFKMTSSDRIIAIYNLSSETNEFIGKGDGYIPAHTGLPAYSTDIAPPSAPPGFVAVFDSLASKWSLVEDHRGKMVYDIHTGEATEINQLGSLPVNVVSVAPDGAYVKWNGEAWVHDAEAEKTALITQAEQKKTGLLMTAESAIAPLARAEKLGIATAEELASLEAWEHYSVMVNRVNTLSPQWPDMPE